MIPDKVFIRPDVFEVPWAPSIDENNKYGGIEYIRKGALLEWLEKAIEGCYKAPQFFDALDAPAKARAFKQAIDKLNEM